MRVAVPIVLAAALACALPSGPARAPAPSPLPTWIDDQGRLRAGAASGSAVAVDPAALARIAALSVHEEAGGYVASVRNLLEGPVEIELSLTGADNVASWPRLPHRMVLGPGEKRPVSLIEPVSPNRPGHFELHLNALPGPPDARHGEVVYVLPLADGAARISQGFGGAFSHQDPENRYAVDFAVPVGTPVLAARDGIVMQVVDEHAEAGLDRAAFASRANHIRVLHEDGSMALYAHLDTGGARVAPGRAVRAGDLLGHSGNTGFSGGPHLHFVVQVNTGMRLESVPFSMRGPDGPVPIPGASGADARPAL